MTNGKREYRPWTDAEQQQAERLYAAGVNLSTIGRTLDRNPSLVKYHLDPGMAEKKRATTLAYHAKHPEWHAQYQKNNPDKARTYSVRWRASNPDKVREIKTRQHQARRQRIQSDPEYKEKVRGWNNAWRQRNREKQLEYYRRYREKNREKIRELSRRYRERKKAKQNESPGN